MGYSKGMDKNCNAGIDTHFYDGALTMLHAIIVILLNNSFTFEGCDNATFWLPTAYY